MKEVIYIKPGYIQLFFKALYERLMNPHRDNSLLLKNIREIVEDELRRHPEYLLRDDIKAEVIRRSADKYKPIQAAQEAAHIITTKYAGAMKNLAEK